MLYDSDDDINYITKKGCFIAAIIILIIQEIFIIYDSMVSDILTFIFRLTPRQLLTRMEAISVIFKAFCMNSFECSCKNCLTWEKEQGTI